MIAFGPVPSRRLGRSLGINNIPPKVCTYSCVYCQVGRTTDLAVERRSFFEPEAVLRAVREKVAGAAEVGEPSDYLTFVPDGEPTLDLELGRTIDLLRRHASELGTPAQDVHPPGRGRVARPSPLGIRIAVITNGSLLWREDVREALMGADWVSVKVDAARESVWRQVNRPHGALRLPAILDGMHAFATAYTGRLVTETMLVEGVNDGEASLREVADVLARLRPAVAYLSVPTRPPAESSVQPPGEEVINRAYHVLDERVEHVEYLIGYEGNAFASTGDVREDLLSITAVHPMRDDAVEELLERAGSDWTVVRELVAQGEIADVDYGGRRFYVRRPKGRQARG